MGRDDSAGDGPLVIPPGHPNRNAQEFLPFFQAQKGGKMISIRSVKGDVAVFDQTNGYLQPAVPGLVLQHGKNYLVACGENSEATIMKAGKATNVAPGEWYVVTRQGIVRQGKHRERGTVKLFIGRVWALIARDNPELNLPGNAVIGVRG